MPYNFETFDDPVELSLMEERIAAYPIPDVPAYDNPHVAVMSGEQRMSNPGSTVHKWGAPIEGVTPELRDRRVVNDPMERILEITGKYPPLDDTVITKLIDKYQKHGDLEAKERVMLHNSRLVMHFAKDYYGRAPKNAVGMEDLFQQGMIGLQRAVEKTDLKVKREKNAAFGTYAAYAIKQHMQRYTDERLGTIRVPVHIGVELVQTRAVMAGLEAELGREPSTAEIAAAMSNYPSTPVEVYDEKAHEDPYDRAFSEQRTQRAKTQHEKGKAAAETVIKERLELSSRIRPLYLSRMRSGFIEEIEDADESINPIIRANQSAREAELAVALAELPHRSRDVLELRNGLDGQGIRTLDAIGKKYNVTRERIRTIEGQSLKDLKLYSGILNLKELADSDDTGDFVTPNHYSYIDSHSNTHLELTGPMTASEYTRHKRVEASRARMAKFRNITLSNVSLELMQDNDARVTRHRRTISNRHLNI